MISMENTNYEYLTDMLIIIYGIMEQEKLKRWKEGPYSIACCNLGSLEKLVVYKSTFYVASTCGKRFFMLV